MLAVNGGFINLPPAYVRPVHPLKAGLGRSLLGYGTMAATLDFDLPNATWTDISSTLTDTVIYSLQNRGAVNIELIERAAPPTDSDIGNGFYLAQRQFTTIQPDSGFEIYARPVYSISSVVIGESV